ncbi:C-C chemokine receptor type 9a [Latimeria chalumnae]|nr:PREDICTED: C-C chemokine receptor type 9 [Latimeria chalumnae]|eukprot:XP_006004153.1 PREDICTED: C-C chemokine receptor type 9 [Latimeria chalumnae]
MGEATSDYSGSLMTSSDYGDYPDLFCDKSSVRQFAQYFLPPFYWSIFLVGIVGNILVVIIYAYCKRLKTMTDVYLLNLAIADLFFLSTLPFWAISAYSSWRFGNFMCKIVNFLYKVNFYSCMLLLTCISIDRYIAIVQATKAQRFKGKRILCSKLACLIIWAVAVVLSLPELLLSEVKEVEDISTCAMHYPPRISTTIKVSVLVLQITVGFLLPFIVMLLCYTVIIHTLLQAKSFQKHKALKVIIAVVAVFIFSQLPYNSILVVKTLDAANATISNCSTSKKIDIATQVTQSIAYLHSCLNPFLYVFIGVRFRHDLIKILKALGCINQFKLGNYMRTKGNSKRISGLSETESTGALSL